MSNKLRRHPAQAALPHNYLVIISIPPSTLHSFEFWKLPQNYLGSSCWWWQLNSPYFALLTNSPHIYDKIELQTMSYSSRGWGANNASCLAPCWKRSFFLLPRDKHRTLSPSTHKEIRNHPKREHRSACRQQDPKWRKWFANNLWRSYP